MLVHQTQITDQLAEGSSGKALGVVDCRNIEGEYGYRQTGGHRASLINTLYHACLQNGVKVSFSTPVTAPLEFHDKPTFSRRHIVSSAM